jgi:hypothetical protein
MKDNENRVRTKLWPARLKRYSPIVGLGLQRYAARLKSFAARIYSFSLEYRRVAADEVFFSTTILSSEMMDRLLVVVITHRRHFYARPELPALILN